MSRSTTTDESTIKGGAIQQLSRWESPDLSVFTKAGVSVPQSYVLEGLRSAHLYSFNLVREVLEEGFSFKDAVTLLAMNLNEGIESARAKIYRALSFIQDNNIHVKLKLNLLASTFDFSIFDELMSLHMHRPDLAKTLTKERLQIYNLVEEEVNRYSSPNLTKIFDYISREHGIDVAKVRTSYRIMQDYLFGLGLSPQYSNKYPKPQNMDANYKVLFARSKTSSRSYYFKSILNHLKRGTQISVTLQDGSQHIVNPPTRQTSKIYALTGYLKEGMTNPYTVSFSGDEEIVAPQGKERNTDDLPVSSAPSAPPKPTKPTVNAKLVAKLRALDLGDLETDSIESVLQNCVDRLGEYETYHRQLETLTVKQALNLERIEVLVEEVTQKAQAYDALSDFLHAYVNTNPVFRALLSRVIEGSPDKKE